MVLICPFCQSISIRLIFEAQDGLNSYQCHDCTRTFHVTELQPREPDESKGKETPRVEAPEGPKKR